MDEQAFRQFLKQGGRSASAIERCVRYTGAYAVFLQQRGKTLATATDEDLNAFVEDIEDQQASAKTPLWAIRYYYQFTGNQPMALFAGALREIRIERRPYALAEFKHIDPGIIEGLAKVGITHVDAMLEDGRTPADRRALAAQTGIPLADIELLVKLADIARIPGNKSVRARLYVEVGADTLEKMAASDPEELRQRCADYIEATGFDGIPPWPAEAAYSVAKARTLKKIVTWDDEE